MKKIQKLYTAALLFYSTPLMDFSCHPNVTIKPGKSFAVRIYPWFAKGSSSPKFLFLGDLSIKGE